jgi:hypothetical protein
MPSRQIVMQLHFKRDEHDEHDVQLHFERDEHDDVQLHFKRSCSCILKEMSSCILKGQSSTMQLHI